MKLIQVPYFDQAGEGAFTGCESVSAVMLLHYLGYPVSIDEFVRNYLDREDFEERDGVLYGPDPWKVFAGDPYDREAMGCYVPVIRNSLMRVLGDRYEVIDETGRPLSYLIENYIDRDMPVILWATIDMKDIIIGPEWKLKDSGETFVWRSNEHCMLLVGYDEDNYIFNDPWQNNGVIGYEKTLLEDRYAKQYSQALGLVRK